jgi:uncharacterized RDD family membrane protein YckC
MTMIQFETPENIQVAYEPAGLGTRFVAWFVDNIIMYVAGFVILLILLCSGTITDATLRNVPEPVRESVRRAAEGEPVESPEVTLFLIGVFLIISGVGSFVYYGFSELCLRGQTIGKRMSGIRVVRLDGFALDAGAILVRNIFRVIDHIPPLWLVPLLSKSSQRLGDIVAGTVVVLDRPESIGDLRATLSQRPAGEAKFAFDAAALKRARPQDFAAVEAILERWDQLGDQQQLALLGQVIPPLVARLQVDPPADDERLRFLSDLLAAEYRRQYRRLG